MSFLQLEDVNSYYGKSHILHDVSLNINEGDFVALIGRNGAGKSTTLKSIMGLVTPRSGTIKFNGENLVDLEPHQISRRGVSLVPERRRIFPQHTVYENLRLGYIEHAEEPIENLLELVYDFFPVLEDQADYKGKALSGGQQQMLAIGRSLMSDPDLLLIDEPSEGLMPSLVEKLRTTLPRINEGGVTILLVEQNVKLALDISTNAYVIDEGIIQSHGASEYLAQDEEIIERYLSL